MVMFKEDEERIKAMEKAEKLSKRGKLETWLRRFFKIGLILAVLFGISLWLLAALGGNHQALKEGIEDYITQATGFEAEIGEFNYMGFFPNLILDAADIKLRDKSEDGLAISVKRVEFATGFLGMIFSRRRFDHLNIKDMYVKEGVLGSEPIKIDTIALDKAAYKDKPGFLVKGAYGAKKLSFLFEMDTKKDKFLLPDSGNFEFFLDEFVSSGHIQKSKWSGLEIHIDKMDVNSQSLSGIIKIKQKFFKNHINLDLDFGKSKVLASLREAKNILKGEVTFPDLVISDIDILAQIYSFWSKAFGKSSERSIDLYEKDIDVSVSIKKLKANDNDLGSIDIHGTVQDQFALIKANGLLSNGALEGTLNLDATSMPAKLKINAIMNKWDYGEYQRAVLGKENLSGTADIRLGLSSKGRNYKELVSDLNGEMFMISGKGKLSSKTLNIWGAGLANAMLPNLSGDDFLTLNCMIADFKVENGIAKPSPFFMDTVRVTVVGEGEVNFPENKINLKLEPKAKDPAFLDVAAAVKVSGKILEPEIGADTFSLFEKIGGLALGIVNPAFLIFSMTDLGLTEDHPCYSFIDKKEAGEALKAEPEVRGPLNE